MTLFIALAGFIFALLGLVMMLVNPPRMSNTPEDEWNRAARNLRKEWDSWKLNRQEEDKQFIDWMDRELTTIKSELVKHIRTAHLEDDANIGAENRNYYPDYEPPIDRDYKGTIAE